MDGLPLVSSQPLAYQLTCIAQQQTSHQHNPLGAR